jgi:preprotein translocase subunit SecG
MLTVVICLVLALSFSLALALLIQRLEGGSKEES